MIRARYLVGLVSAFVGVAIAWTPAATAAQNPTSSLADVSWTAAQHSSVAASCANNLIIKSLGNGKLVSTELGYTGGTYGMLRARTPANALGPWERFH